MAVFLEISYPFAHITVTLNHRPGAAFKIAAVTQPDIPQPEGSGTGIASHIYYYYLAFNLKG